VTRWVAGVTVCAMAAFPAPTLANGVYVFNLEEATVSQFSSGAGGALSPLSPATVPTGKEPAGLAISPNGHDLYVSAEPPPNVGAVWQYSIAADGALTPLNPETAEAGGYPIGVAVSPDGQNLYVADQLSGVSQYSIAPDGALSPLNPATVPAGGAPGGIAVSPNGRNLYVANFSEESVSQYSIAPDGALTPLSPATVPTGDAPFGLEISPNGQNLYVANTNELGSGEGSVSQYSIAPDGALTPLSPATVATGQEPQDIAISPSGQSLYVTNLGANTVSQFSVTAGGALTALNPATVPAGDLPIGDALAPDGQTLYVANADENSVSQYSIAEGGALTPLNPAIVATGLSPTFVAVTPDRGPTAAFSATPAPAGSASTFSAVASSAGSEPISDYAWQFSDGTTASGASVSHVFSTAGTYTATLTLTDSDLCSTVGPFTGQTAFCTPDPAATSSETITVPAAAVTQATVPPTVVVVSNAFSIAHVRAGKNGVVRFSLTLPGPGTLDILETAADSLAKRAAAGLLKPGAGQFSFGSQTLAAHGKGTIAVTVKPDARGRRALRSHRHITIDLRIEYAPTGGMPSTHNIRRLRVGK